MEGRMLAGTMTELEEIEIELSAPCPACSPPRDPQSWTHWCTGCGGSGKVLTWLCAPRKSRLSTRYPLVLKHERAPYITQNFRTDD